MSICAPQKFRPGACNNVTLRENGFGWSFCGAPRVILATGSYIGEGFDDARLDTLFLAMPISWRGTLQQYVGRLHRLHDAKRVVRVYDYVDSNVLMLARMYARRLKGYNLIGYTIRDASNETSFFEQVENRSPIIKSL